MEKKRFLEEPLFIFLYTHSMRDNNRASITPFFIIVVSLIVIVGAIVFEYAFFKFNYSKQKVEMYSYMDKVMSGYNKKIFNEIGLLCNENKDLELAISTDEVLEKQVRMLMKEKYLVKTITKAEDIVSEFLKKKTKVDVKVFDISSLNLKLYEIISGESTDNEIIDFVTNLSTVSLYADLHNISVSSLKEMIEHLKFKELRKIKPVFVIKNSIRENYEKIVDAYVKYDKLGLYKHYVLADYAVEYLGYDFTKSDNNLTSEYVATGVKNKKINRLIISADIFSLRLLLDFFETLGNPKIRNKLMKTSFNIPELFAIESVAVASIEAFYDTNRIIHGGKIPLYKGEEGFIVFNIGDKYYKKGFTYPSYLKMILMLNSKEKTLQRFVDVIEDRFQVKADKMFTKIHVKRRLEFKGKLIPFTFSKILEGELSYE